MLLVLVGVMTAMAGSDIKVTEGNKKFLKTAEGNAILVFDWEGATFDNKEPLASKFSNLEELRSCLKFIQNSFMGSFQSVFLDFFQSGNPVILIKKSERTSSKTLHNIYID